MSAQDALLKQLGQMVYVTLLPFALFYSRHKIQKATSSFSALTQSEYRPEKVHKCVSTPPPLARCQKMFTQNSHCSVWEPAACVHLTNDQGAWGCADSFKNHQLRLLLARGCQSVLWLIFQHATKKSNGWKRPVRKSKQLLYCAEHSWLFPFYNILH